MTAKSKIWNGVKKKAKRIKVRRSWTINPKTRVKKSEKRYSRKDKMRLLRGVYPERSRGARNDVLEGDKI